MERKRKRTRAYVRSYYRMALMIDMIQLQIENAGAFCIPAYAFILVFCGWELKTWTSQGKGGKRCQGASSSTTSAGNDLGSCWQSNPRKNVSTGR